jgi:hypothetical protein
MHDPNPKTLRIPSNLKLSLSNCPFIGHTRQQTKHTCRPVGTRSASFAEGLQKKPRGVSVPFYRLFHGDPLADGNAIQSRDRPLTTLARLLQLLVAIGRLP